MIRYLSALAQTDVWRIFRRQQEVLKGKKVADFVKLIVTPASRKIYKQAKRYGESLRLYLRQVRSLPIRVADFAVDVPEEFCQTENVWLQPTTVTSLDVWELLRSRFIWHLRKQRQVRDGRKDCKSKIEEFTMKKLDLSVLASWENPWCATL